MAVETLAQKLGISESTAHRHIHKLQAHGVLEVKTQFRAGSAEDQSRPLPDA